MPFAAGLGRREAQPPEAGGRARKGWPWVMPGPAVRLVNLPPASLP